MGDESWLSTNLLYGPTCSSRPSTSPNTVSKVQGLRSFLYSLVPANKKNAIIIMSYLRSVDHNFHHSPLSALSLSFIIDRHSRVSIHSVQYSVYYTTMTIMVHFPTKEERFSAALEAAKVGQLTRLCEVVVEGVAEEKEDYGDQWELKSGLQVELLRSSFVQIIHEAAALGSMKQLEAYEVCNWSNDNNNEEEKKSKPQDLRPITTIRAGPVKRRASLLVECFLEKQKSQRQLPINCPSERLEQWGAAAENSKVRAKSCWSTSDPWSFEYLPSPKVPRIPKRFASMPKQRLAECLIQGVAEKAHDRAWRIQQQNKLKITHRCDCVYCVHPSPMQTQSYQKLRYSQFMGPAAPPKEETKEEEESKEVELPTPLVPTFVVKRDHHHHHCGGRSEKDLMTEVVQKVAARAWDRQLKLQRTAHRVTQKCTCTYCGHACPQQTEQYKSLAQSPQVQRRLLQKWR
jgi:hypothetical protein